MALTIKENNGVFTLAGAINATTVQLFKVHMDAIMRNNKEVTLHIGKVDEIDPAGLSILRDFYMKSKNENQGFYIVGYGCKELYHEFNNSYAA